MSGVKKRTDQAFLGIDRALGTNFREKEHDRKNFEERQERDRIAAEDLQKKQSSMLDRQKAEIDARKRKLTRTQMQFLKARFSLAGGASGRAIGTNQGVVAGQQAPADLFQKITGRD